MLKPLGTEQARAAVAEKFNHPDAPLTSRDVILANGCSGALDLAINVLCTEGQNMLIPRPGFSLYENLAVSRFIEAKFYNLVVGDSYVYVTRKRKSHQLITGIHCSLNVAGRRISSTWNP